MEELGAEKQGTRLSFYHQLVKNKSLAPRFLVRTYMLIVCFGGFPMSHVGQGRREGHVFLRNGVLQL